MTGFDQYGGERSEIRGIQPHEWQPFYSARGGWSKMAHRLTMYEVCLEQEPGQELEKPIDFDTEVIKVFDLIYGKQEQGGVIVDIGCGNPFLLNAFWITGHNNCKLVGTDPSPEQFAGLPFWRKEPIKQGPANHQLSRDTFVLDPNKGKWLPDNVVLFESDANHIPIEDNSAMFLTILNVIYHVEKSKQAAVFDEIRRVLTKIASDIGDPKRILDSSADVEGIMALSTGGMFNKKKVYEDGVVIASKLSDLVGTEIFPPISFSAGFASEDADEILPEKFKHVYALRVDGALRTDNINRMNAYLGAHRTKRDSYICADPKLEEKKNEKFEGVLMEVVGKKISEGCFEDEAHRTLYICSDRPLGDQLPAYFERVLPQAA